MKYILFTLLSFLLPTLQAQTLEGNFSSVGVEEATADIQLTTTCGQPFGTSAENNRLACGFMEMAALANESTEMTSLSINRKTASMETGDRIQLAATVLPESANNKAVRWHSSDPSVAMVSEGTVRALSPGTTTITATSASGLYTDICTVAVTRSEPDPKPEPQPIRVTGIALDQSDVILQTGETLRLVATIRPSDADNQLVSWTSSDEQVATVDQGTIVAKQEGTATIRVTTVDGSFTDECLITVEAASTGIETIETGGHKVYPTLVRNDLHIEVQQPQTVYLISQSGRICHILQANAGCNIIRMQSYPSGIYFVRLTNETVKVMKQ